MIYGIKCSLKITFLIHKNKDYNIFIKIHKATKKERIDLSN